MLTQAASQEINVRALCFQPGDPISVEALEVVRFKLIPDAAVIPLIRL